MLKSKISAVLERIISKYISESLSKKICKRYQILSEHNELVLKDLGHVISEFSTSIFVREARNGRDSIFLARSDDVFELVRISSELNETISFIWNDGAITVSFDESVEETHQELHLICWGAIIPYADGLVERFNGVRY